MWKSVADDLDVLVTKFNHFGMGWFRSQQIHGDTVIQLAFQLAYQRLYQKPAPTYETAATRRFFHGRTETMRSCTEEAQHFVHAMLNPTATRQQRLEAFAGILIHLFRNTSLEQKK